MIRNRYAARTLAVCLSAGLLCLSGAALAHGDMGEHVDEFQTHLDDYEQDIQGLIATADGIVADYGQADDLQARADALVDDWENVDFHEALETHAISLYPPIWSAIGGLEAAIVDNEDKAEVVTWQRRFEAALWQGMGALKYVAQHPADSSASAHAEGDPNAAASGPETIDIIKTQLDDALAAYRDGDAEQATSLVHSAYMQRFEGVEGDLIERQADLVTGLEKDFNATLPRLIDEEADAERVADRIDAMKADLDTARKLLVEAESEKSSVF